MCFHASKIQKSPSQHSETEIFEVLITNRRLLNHDLRHQCLAFAHGFQEIYTLLALAEIEDGTAFHTIFINFTTRDVVHLNIPLASAKVEVEGTVGGIGIDYNIGSQLLN